MLIATALAAALLAAIHFFAGRLRFLDRLPRSRWLSFAGGVAVSYIFLHILPELAEHQKRLQATAFQPIYLLALIGLAAFYALERWVKSHGRRGGDGEPPPGVFWIHLGSFAVYNALIGYLLLHREEAGYVWLLVYLAAMAMHFVTNDVGLRSHHRRLYRHYGRWLLAGSILIGWFAGLAIDIHETAVNGVFAFLAGGVILNVLKEELPEERESSLGAFLVGVVVYAAVVLAANHLSP